MILNQTKRFFVGPNNSGKTSATAAMRCFIDNKDFKVHDFSVSKVSGFNAFIEENDSKHLPAIELDIWFAVDPDSIEFGRAFSLLPKLSGHYTELGVRLRFEASDTDRLRSDYLEQHPLGEDGLRRRSLFHYLGVGRNLNKYFHTSYYSLERVEADVVTYPLSKDEGKNSCKISCESILLMRNETLMTMRCTEAIDFQSHLHLTIKRTLNRLRCLKMQIK